MRLFLLIALSFLPALLQAQTTLHRPIVLVTSSGTLYGSLLLPKHDGPMPVALLIAGSGPTDRNGNNPQGNNDSLRKLAELLAKHGIASVRYDKRGIAASRLAGQDERNLSVEAYKDDAIAWARQLKADTRFSRLYLIGHSEGALIASLAAPRSRADALVSIAGSGRPLAQVLEEQLRKHQPPALLPESLALIRSLEQGKIHNLVSPQLMVLFRPSVQPYLISLFRQDPAKAFKATRMRALIIQGSTDMQVSEEDAKRLHEARPDSQLALVPGMNHVMAIVPADAQRQLASYDDPGLPLADSLGNLLSDFLNIDSSPRKNSR
ncbi:alpha/beta hydrolase [Pseudomonas sp. LRF_L74]|uniref:alpha/beta hydrolase n=1 Tax=Pseudomonas sp. LRF_L74 TaxID=3369422 RepID=UPI003F61A4E0